MDAPLNDQELDELDAFLDSDTLSEDSMDLSTMDGFFAAIALNPEFILPGQWLPWVWDMEEGEETPAFANAEEADRIHGLLLRHYNHVQDMMRVRKVHLIAISPASTVFRFGQMLQAGHHPEYTIYDRAGRDDKFVPAFSITGHDVSACCDGGRPITISIR